MDQALATKIAHVAHETNRAFCATLGDFTQLPWAEAPDWQKLSAINGVWFHSENPNADAAASHNNWLKVKVSEGWKYGPTKDADRRLHPCMVPYDELPRDQRIKDYLFKAVVHAIMDVP